jgi:hypothetical protein
MSSYYRPYTSGSDSDSGSESDGSSIYSSDLGSSDSGSSTSSPPLKPSANFRALAEGLSLTGLAGPSFDLSGELVYVKNPVGSPLNAEPMSLGNYEIKPDPSGVQLKSSSASVNSIIMLNSTDRDRNAYKQPTNVTLRLPRVYSNVTSFQIVQIKLLSAFYYFRASKQNTFISILENGRTNTVSGNTVDAIVKSTIREGTYDINSLLSEIMTQLNVTPLFYDFPNGFQDFAIRFSSTGDFFLNFNQPGDNYYDSLADIFIPNPTVATIISRYFEDQFAGQSSYTTDQIKIAYYYPVLKECLLDPGVETINLDVSAGLLPGETPYTRIIYTFEGIDDPFVLSVINLNLAELDDYRFKHTFRFGLVNKYTATLQAQSNKITISTTSLNTSLLNLITGKQAQFQSEELGKNNLTPAQFAALQTQNSLLLAVVNDMFYFLQQYLAIYFGIPFNTYDISYIANPTYYIPIRDATNAVGISSNFDATVVARNTPPITTNITAQFQQGSKHYWPDLTSIDVLARPFNLDEPSNHPYSVRNDYFDTSRNFVDLSSEQLYANPLLRYADIVIPLDAEKYTIFKFKSPVRQTLQIETLPRPTKYRYPAYNAITYDQQKQQLFDNSYAYVWNRNDSKLDWILSKYNYTINAIPGYEELEDVNNYGATYAQAVGFWENNNPQYINSYVGNNVFLYYIHTTFPPVDFTQTYRYSISATITTLDGSNFATPMKMFIYHDRAAMLADLSSNGNEDPFNYNYKVTTTTDVSSATVSFKVYPQRLYYILSRPLQDISPTQNYRIVVWFPSTDYETLTSSLDGFDPLADPTTPASLLNTNYANVNDPAFIALPVDSNLIPVTKVDPLYAPLTYSSIAIGYDVSGISTDATDYFGYDPNKFGTDSGSTSRIDPVNGYIMQKISPYNTSTQTYFDPTSKNAILSPGGSNIYSPRAVQKRQATITHQYYTHYLPSSLNQEQVPANGSIPSEYVSPFTLSSTSSPIGGYSYAGQNANIQLGDGIIGISFVPEQGVWNIERAMFASAYNGVTIDPNSQIQYLGVFLTSSLPADIGFNTMNPDGFFSANSSLALLKLSKTTVYSGDQGTGQEFLNFGFGVGGGTFYEFTRDYTYQPNTNQNIYGYSQIRRQFNPDSNSIYTLVAFDENYLVCKIYGLLGSLVPYPLINNVPVDVSGAYFDGNTTPNGRQLLIPTNSTGPVDPSQGPPAGYDETQSKYELSMPIGTNAMHYLIPYDFLTQPNSMNQWSGCSVTANAVFDCPAYLITFDTVFHVYYYTPDFTNLTFAVNQNIQPDTTDDLVMKMNEKLKGYMKSTAPATQGSSLYTFDEVYQFTVDQIIWPTVNSFYIGMAANIVYFAFFSYSLDGNINITVMEPTTGKILKAFTYTSPFDFRNCNLVTSSFNSLFGYSLSVNSQLGVSSIYYKPSQNDDGITITLAAQDSSVDSLIGKQCSQVNPDAPSPFYVFLSLNGIINSFAIITFNNQTTVIDPRFVVTGAESLNINLVVYYLNDNYTSPSITRIPYKDIISFIKSDSTSIFQVTAFEGETAILTPSTYTFPGTPTALYQGGAGSIWALYGNTFYGNRGGFMDAPKGIDSAWQIFYPMQRIVFTKVANNFTFMQDRTNLEYPEYPHTAIAVYESLEKLQADLGDVTDPSGGRWGLETSGNILAADFAFSGEVFGASVFSVPLQVSEPGSYYYAAVRNYSPTEKSQVLLRCSLNNRYDFGYVKLTDLSGEVGLAATSSNLFSPEYYKQLIAFNSNFTFAEKTFGANIIKGFNGSNFSNLTGFGDFYSRFVDLYSTYNNQVKLVQTITSNVNSNVNAFIQTDLQNILPASAQYRQRFTDPLTFSILWKSPLSPEYAKLEDQWGLGWNLGYNKADTSYSTVHLAPSFFKILDDFISLRLNPEFDMNRMDSGAKENLYLTQEPTGSTKTFHAKLLLASFGSYAQTLISNPVSFSPPVGKMDKITFQWLDAAELIIDNSDCEWNVVVQVVEKKEVVEIPKPALVYQGRT